MRYTVLGCIYVYIYIYICLTDGIQSSAASSGGFWHLGLLAPALRAMAEANKEEIEKCKQIAQAALANGDAPASASAAGACESRWHQPQSLSPPAKCPFLVGRVPLLK